MKDVWTAIRDFEPRTPQEQCFYNSIIETYTTMSNSRRIRLVEAEGSVSPVLWVVLFVGAIITVGFTYLFVVERLGSQILMISLVCTALSLNLYLVIINSSPFFGDFKLRPIAFKVAAKFIEDKDSVPKSIQDF